MAKTFKLIALFVTLLAATGCTGSKFAALPTQPADFRLSPTDIRSRYPDINKYDPKLRTYFLGPAQANDLFEKWGEPQKQQARWLDFSLPYVALGVGGVLFWGPLPPLAAGGMALAAKPSPTVDYYWLKEKYCIQATVGRALLSSNGPIMYSWTWYERENSPALPEQCR